MKELFKKYPMLHYTVVLTVIAIVMGLVIGGINAWTEPIIEQNAIDAKNAIYREILPELDTTTDLLSESDASTIVDKVAAFDENEEFIAFIFNAEKTNSYGELSMVVSIDADGKILGAEYLVLSQTLYLDRTASNLALYIGTNIMDLTPNGDLQGGATYSKTTMIELLTDISVSFDSIEGDFGSNPMDEAFGSGWTSTNDDDFSAVNEVVAKSDIKNAEGTVVGYTYTLVGSSIYETGSSEEGQIQAVVTINTSNEIVMIELPASEYTQSKGNRYTNVTTYAKTFIGVNLSDFNSDADLLTGSTNSSTLIVELLSALKGVVIPS